MPRSSSRLPLILFVVALFVLGLYITKRTQTSRVSQGRQSRVVSIPRERAEPEFKPKRAPRHPARFRKAPAEQEESWADLGVSCTSSYFTEWHDPAEGACETLVRNGYPVPDPRCTPGGVNPSITAQLLTSPGWRTRYIRNCVSSESQKHVAYRWYGATAPHPNSGDDQVCELDHLVPLELGGADGLGNIWPQCGPDATTLNNRYFKIKDRVETYLAEEVKAGRMSLEEAQRGIAEDWTQYLPAIGR